MSKNKTALARSRSIDHQINEDRERRQREIQLLILGGASSGKSTFIKQMRLHFGDGFPDNEREKYIPQVRGNLTDVIHIIGLHMKALSVEYKEKTTQDLVMTIQKKFPRLTLQHLLNQLPEEDDMEPHISSMDQMNTTSEVNCVAECEPEDLKNILAIWGDDGVQMCYSRRQEWHGDQISEAEYYFLTNIERICSKDYVPSVQDILYIRRPTLGVQEHSFNIDSLIYRVIDVAGQKSQRKKWIHFFEGVTAVIFLASLSGFAEKLEEDRTINNLHDSLQLFHEVGHNQYLEKTDFILFLNKHDVFLEKIKTRSITECFPHYKGENTGEAYIRFIKEQFLQHKPGHKQVYIHVSCATDVNMMKNILANVLDIIIEMNLRKTGMC